MPCPKELQKIVQSCIALNKSSYDNVMAVLIDLRATKNPKIIGECMRIYDDPEEETLVKPYGPFNPSSSAKWMEPISEETRHPIPRKTEISDSKIELKEESVFIPIPEVQVKDVDSKLMFEEAVKRFDEMCDTVENRREFLKKGQKIAEKEMRKSSHIDAIKRATIDSFDTETEISDSTRELKEDTNYIFVSIIFWHLKMQMKEYFNAFSLIEKLKQTHFEYWSLYARICDSLNCLEAIDSSIYARKIKFDCFLSAAKENWLLIDKIETKYISINKFIKNDLSDARYFFGSWLVSKNSNDKAELVQERYSKENFSKIREHLAKYYPNLISTFDDQSSQKLINVSKFEKFFNEKLVFKEVVELEVRHVIQRLKNVKEQLPKFIEDLFSEFQSIENGLADKENQSSPSIVKNLSEQVFPIPGYFFQLRKPPVQKCNHPSHSKEENIVFVPDSLILSQLKRFECCSQIPMENIIYLNLYVKFCGKFDELIYKDSTDSTNRKLSFIKAPTAYRELDYFLFLCIQPGNKRDVITDEVLILLDDPKNYKDHERIPCFDCHFNFFEIEKSDCLEYFHSNEKALESLIAIDINLNAWLLISDSQSFNQDWKSQFSTETMAAKNLSIKSADVFLPLFAEKLTLEALSDDQDQGVSVESKNEFSNPIVFMSQVKVYRLQEVNFTYIADDRNASEKSRSKHEK